MNRKILIAGALGLGLSLTGAAAALAQGGFQGPMNGGPGFHKVHGGPGFGPGRDCGDRAARQAGMLAYAEKKLNVTEAQRGAWNAVVAAVKSGDDAFAKACEATKAAAPKPAEGDKKPAPPALTERLDRMQTFANLRVEQLNKVVPAVKALYEQLSPEQKATADKLMSHGPFAGRDGKGGMHDGSGPRDGGRHEGRHEGRDRG